MIFGQPIYYVLISLTPSIILYPSPSLPIIQQFQCFLMPSSYTDTMCFNIIHSVSFFFPLPPPPIENIIYVYIHIYVCVYNAYIMLIYDDVHI
jgi:hypothetical protein